MVGSVPADDSRALTALRRAIFLISLPFGILGFVLPIYGKQIGASAVEIGLFFSAFSLMTVVMRPLVGAAIDRLGRKPFFLLGLAGYAASMVAFAFMAQVWGIIAARTLQGMASALLWLAARAVAADVAGAGARAATFGSVDQVSNQAGILGTFAGFYVLMNLDISRGWQPLFLGYAAFSLAGVFIAWRSLPETLPARVPDATPGSDVPLRQSVEWSRSWVLLLLVSLVTAASWAMVSPVLMIYLQERLHAGVSELAWAFLPSALVWAMLPSRLGVLADRFGRKPLMLLGLAVASVTSFVTPSLSSMVAFGALWAVQALCYAAGDPAEQALVTDLTGREERGRAFGLYMLAGGLGMTVGPLAGGWLYDSFGGAVPFRANAVILALCGLALAIWLREPGRPAPATAGNRLT